MKKIKRFTALLLAGVLALAVLTGCGSSFGKQVEEAFIQYTNLMNQQQDPDAEELVNDPALRAQAAKMLNQINPETGLIPWSASYKNTLEQDGDTEVYTYWHVLLDESGIDYHRDAYAFTVEDLADLRAQIESMKQQMATQMVERKLTAVGVATRTVNGKTYLAFGYRAVTCYSEPVAN